ncbi:dynein heavy chain and region D6 of dynein motor-domain-containing protein [Phlyctochytrium arcticum]|nr:dynein heavy chain and region D6 of dynein motor-domain-containing protein [Phlyctochytrium arcticum]
MMMQGHSTDDDLGGLVYGMHSSREDPGATSLTSASSSGRSSKRRASFAEDAVLPAGLKNSEQYLVIKGAIACHAQPVIADPAYLRAEANIESEYRELQLLIGEHPIPCPPQPPPQKPFHDPSVYPKISASAVVKRGKLSHAKKTHRRQHKEAVRYEAKLPSNKILSRPASARSERNPIVALPRQVSRENLYDPSAASRVLAVASREDVIVPEGDGARADSYTSLVEHPFPFTPWRSSAHLPVASRPGSAHRNVNSGDMHRRSPVLDRSRPTSGRSIQFMPDTGLSQGGASFTGLPSRPGSGRQAAQVQSTTAVMSRPQSAKSTTVDRLRSRPSTAKSSVGASTRPGTAAEIARPHSAKSSEFDKLTSRTGTAKSSIGARTRPSSAHTGHKTPHAGRRRTAGNDLQRKLSEELSAFFSEANDSDDMQDHLEGEQRMHSEQLEMYVVKDDHTPLGGRDPYKDFDDSQTSRQTLDLYDDPEFEVHSPAEWLALGTTKGQKGALGYSRYFQYGEAEAEWQWLPCFVLDYDSASQRYLIEWIPSGPQKYVRRLNILFDIEDREMFYRRIETAIKARTLITKQADYLNDIDQRDGSHLYPLPKSLKRAILDRLGYKVTSDKMTSVERHLKRVEEEFLFAMKRAENEYLHGPFESMLQLPSSTSETFTQIALARSGMDIEDPAGQLFCEVATATREMAAYMFTANANVQRAIVEVLAALREVLPLDEGFFHKDFGFPAPFLAFCERSETHSGLVASCLATRWLRRICDSMQHLLGDFFNFGETSELVYKQSRLRDFLRLVTIIMESQLKLVLLESTKTFLALFNIAVTYRAASEEEVRKFKLAVPSPESGIPIPCMFVVYVTATAGENLEITRPSRTINDFKVSQEGSVVLDPPLEYISQKLLELLMLPQKLCTDSIPHIETVAMTALHTEATYLYGSISQELVVEDGIRILSSLQQQAYPAIGKLLEAYQEYDFLLRPVDGMPEWDNIQLDVVALEKVIKRYFSAAKTIDFISPAQVEIPPFVLECSTIKMIFQFQARRVLKTLQDNLMDRFCEFCTFLTTAFSDLYSQILTDPGQDTALWQMAKNAVETCMQQVGDYDDQLREVQVIWQLMYNYEFSLEESVNDLYWTTCAWPMRLSDEINRASERLSDARERIIGQLNVDRDYVHSSALAYMGEVRTYLSDAGDVANYLEIERRVLYLRHRLDKVWTLGQSIPVRENHIGVPITSLAHLDSLESEFKHYEALWLLVGGVFARRAEWLGLSFADLNAPLMVDTVTHWKLTVTELTEPFKNVPNSRAVLSRIEGEIMDFDRHLSIIVSLRNPNLRDKHWEEMSGIVGITLQEINGLKLSQVLELDLELVRDILSDISKEATLEAEFEMELDNMRAEISARRFVLVPYVTSDYHLIENFPDAMALLQDLLIRSERLLQRCRAMAMKPKIEAWVKRLNKSQETLEEWEHLQQIFVKLFPVLRLSGEIAYLTREQADNFVALTKLFSMLSDVVTKSRKFSAVFLRSDLLEMISGGLSRIDSIFGGVIKLIEAKRDKFPRFWFLTNDQVLEMISCLPNVSALNPLLVRCFDGIKELQLAEIEVENPEGALKGLVTEFLEDKHEAHDGLPPLAKLERSAVDNEVDSADEADDDVSSIAPPPPTRRTTKHISLPPSGAFARRGGSQGIHSEVQLLVSRKFTISERMATHVQGIRSFEDELTPIIPSVVASMRVEVWLAQLEVRIRESIKDSVMTALKTIPDHSATPQFIYKYPLQVVLVVAQIRWTKFLKTVILEESDVAVKEYRKSLSKEIDDLISLFKTNMTAYHRRAVESTILAASYTLATAQGDISSLSEPDWISRLRYEVSDDGNVTMHCMYHSIPYGYEYIGTAPRMIITTSNNRTIAQVIGYMKNGGNSLVTGEYLCRETIIELSRLVGARCVVIDSAINKSWAGDIMNRIMNGLFRSGCWVCLDQIQHIPDLDLSNIVQHIGTTLRAFNMALRARRTKFTYDDREFDVSELTTIFATYDGKRKLSSFPVNLKSYFRPIAIAVPDTDIYLETALTAQNFSTAAVLARKVVAVTRALTNTLPPDCGYNFSISRISLLAQAAGRVLWNEEFAVHREASIVAGAIENILGSQLRKEHRPLFKHMLDEVFGEERRRYPFHILETAARKIALEHNLVLSDHMMEKLQQLYESLCLDRKVIVTGETLTGKSTLLRLLQDTLIQFEKDPDNKTLVSFTSYPAALDHDNIVGVYQQDAALFRNGVIFTLVERAVSHVRSILGGGRTTAVPSILSKAGLAWIIIDIASSFAVLDLQAFFDEHRTIFSSLTPAINIPGQIRMILELTDLRNITPATVLNSSLIHMCAEELSTSSIVLGEFQKRTAEFQDFSNYLLLVHKHIAMPIFDTILASGKSCFFNSVSILCHQTIRVFTALLTDLTCDGFSRFTVGEQHAWFLASFLFSVIQAAGSLTDAWSRLKLDFFVKETVLDRCLMQLAESCSIDVKDFQEVAKLKSQASVYDCYFDPRLFAWTSWGDMTVERDLTVQPANYQRNIIISSDTIRVAFFAQLLMTQGHSPLIVGAEGAGKTTAAHVALNPANLAGYNGVPLLLTESSPTVIRGKLERRLIQKRRGTFGCPNGIRLYVFVDDVSTRSSQPNDDSAHAGMEFWRQYFEGGGWFGGKRGTEWFTAEDISVLAAMGNIHPTRTMLSSMARQLRHFIPISLDSVAADKVKSFTYESMLTAFAAIAGADCSELASLFLQATDKLFNAVKKTFVTSYVNPHYLFGIRDELNVIKTLLRQANKSSLVENIVHAWGHACRRGVRDKLSASDDVDKFDALFRACVEQCFAGMEYDDIFFAEDPLIYLPDQSARTIGSTPCLAWKAVTSLPGLSQQLRQHQVELPRSSETMTQYQPENLQVALQLCHSTSLPNTHAILLEYDSGGSRAVTELASRLQSSKFLEHRTPSSINETMIFAIRMILQSDEIVTVFACWKDFEVTNELLHFFSSGIPTAFAEAALDDDYTELYRARMAYQQAETDGGREEVVLSCAAYLREKLHIVLSYPMVGFPENFIRDRARFPAIFRSSFVMWTPRNSKTSVNFNLMPIVKKHIALKKQSETLCRLFSRVNSDFCMNEDLGDNHSNEIRSYEYAYETAFKTFDRIFDEKNSDIVNEIQAVQLALQRHEWTVKSVEALQIYHNMWTAKLDETILKTREFLKDMEDEREAIDRAKSDLSKDNDTLGRIQVQLKELRSNYASEFSKVAPQLTAAQKNVEMLPKNDIYEIKSMISPPKIVQILGEALLILFKFELKSGESNWDASKRLLSDKFLFYFGQFDIEAVTTPQILRVESCFKNADFRAGELNRIARALGLLAAWVIAVQRFHNTAVALQPRKREIQELEARIDERQKAIIKSNSILAQLEAKLTSMRFEFDGKIKEKELVHSQHKEAEHRYNEALKLLPSCTYLAKVWGDEMEDLQRRQTLLLPQVLFASWTIVYLSNTSPQKRAAVYNRWSLWLDEEEIVHANISTTFELCEFLQDGRMHEYFVTQNLPVDKETYSALLIARMSVRFPLLFDPYERLYPWIQTLERTRRLDTLESDAEHSDDLVATLLSAMRKGMPLVVHIRGSDMNPLLLQILRTRHYAQLRSLSEFEIDFEGSRFTVDAAFRIYFLHYQHPGPVLEDWARYLQPVQLQLDKSAIHHNVYKALLANEAPKYLDQRKELDMQKISNANALRLLGRKGRDFMVGMNDPDLWGGTLHDSVIDIEERATANMNSSIILGQLEKDLDVHLDWYRNVANIMAGYMTILLRWHNVQNRYLMDIDKTYDLHVKLITPVPENDYDRLNTAKQLFVRSLHKRIASAASPEDRILLWFLMTVEWTNQEFEKSHTLYFPAKHCEVLLQLSSTTAESEVLVNGAELPSNPSSWLEDTCWRRLCSLTCLPVFQKDKFPQDFVRFANTATTPEQEQSWENVYRSVRPWLCKLPGKWQSKLTLSEKLLVIASLRPDSLICAMEDFAMRVFGDGILSYDIAPMVSALERGPLVPILYMDSTTDDPITKIRTLAGKRNMTNLFSIISVAMEPLSAVSKAIDDAMGRGKWLLLINAQYSVEYLKHIEKHIRGKLANRDDSINPQFRLWISLSSDRHIPSFFFRHAAQVLAENGSEIKRRLYDTYAVLEDNLNPFELKATQSYKSQLLNVALLHTLLVMRLKYGVTSFTKEYDFAPTDFPCGINALRNVMSAAGEKQITKKVVHAVGDSVYGAQMTSVYDKRLLSAIFHELLQHWESDSSLATHFTTISEALQRGDLRSYQQCVHQLRGDLWAAPDLVGLCPNSNSYLNQNLSASLLSGWERFVGFRPKDTWSISSNQRSQNLITIVTDLLSKIRTATTDTFLHPGSAPSARVAYRGIGYYLDNVLDQNIIQYRQMIAYLYTALSNLLDRLHLGDSLTEEDLRVCCDLESGSIPTLWRPFIYTTSLSLSKWTKDLVSRIKYLRNWTHTRHGDHHNALRTLIIHDVTKVYSPRAFMQALLNDVGLARRDNTSIELEAIMVSSKQTSPPDVGCYVAGLTLIGAGWDKTHSRLKELKDGEHNMYLGCVNVVSTVLEKPDGHTSKQS